MLTTDYSQTYATYRFSTSYWDALIKVVRYIGPVAIGLALLGLVALFKDRNTRLVGLGILVQLVVTFVLFARTQDFDLHHYYLLVPAIAILITAAFLVLARARGPLTRGIQVALACLMFFGLTTTLTPLGDALPMGLSLLVPDATRNTVLSAGLSPLVRNDMDSLHELGGMLQALLQTDKTATIYVAASSPTFSDDVVRASLPGVQDSVTRYRILSVHQVDGRDGFPDDWPEASYVLLATPTQYHLAPHDQETIGVLAKELAPGGFLNDYYRELPESFSLDGGVTVHVLARTQQIPTDTIQHLRDEFNQTKLNG
jgi:hypothetical protein